MIRNRIPISRVDFESMKKIRICFPSEKNIVAKLSEVWYNMTIDTKGMDFAELNRLIRESDGGCRLEHCIGQRFIAAGVSGKSLTIDGIPGNALGAYLNGAEITVNGNAQDAVGDTMNEGKIVIKGNIGDAAGYAMRGGKIFVKGNAGYRAGIHMKAYKEKNPLWSSAGAQAAFSVNIRPAGIIIVLGLNTDGKPIVGNFPAPECTAARCFENRRKGHFLPRQVSVKKAEPSDLEEIAPIIEEYCEAVGLCAKDILPGRIYRRFPDSKIHINKCTLLTEKGRQKNELHTR